eukprot:TRINITY_DN12925_c0_g1_i1.p1 TRINITY_DN12925_c0_g1~~TRINITY_DN12925_c0_g1_i1.p1  ORF type:complete len:159 (-),score=50.49 TRINITY_DN12925_c0_g1_i1:28-504(-)
MSTKKGWMLGSKYLVKLGNEVNNRGVGNALASLYKNTTLRWGTKMGEDQFGNTYYENLEDTYGGRTRWVEFKNDVEATSIPPEWHQWVHYVTDSTPEQLPEIKEIKYQRPYHRNFTGTDKKYLPPSYFVKENKYTKAKGGHELFDPQAFQQHVKIRND